MDTTTEPTPEVTAETAVQTAEENLEVLRPRTVIEWDIPGLGKVTQRPLSFFGKNEFFALMARAIDRTLEKGYSLTHIVNTLSIDEDTAERMRAGDVDLTQFTSVEDLVRLITKIFSDVPELLMEAYLLWLGIPHERRDFSRVYIEQIDDETGFGILNGFIEQNLDSIVDFLPAWWKHGKAISEKVQEKMR